MAQVCGASSSQKMLQDLGLAEASVFKFTKTCTTANGIDDAPSFDRTKQALHFIGFDAPSQQSIFAAVSAVLHVGNLTISENGEGNAKLESDRHLQVGAPHRNRAEKMLTGRALVAEQLRWETVKGR